MLVSDGGERLDAIRRERDGITLERQDALDRLAEALVVLGDQDPRLTVRRTQARH
jgi:hypothetical protein